MSLTKGGSHFLFSLPLFFGHLLVVVIYVLCTLVQLNTVLEPWFVGD